MIAQLGTTEIAAVGIGARIMWIINSIIFSFGITMSIFLSQSYGSRNDKEQKQYAKLGLVLTLGISVFLALPTYFMSEQVSRFLSNDESVIELASLYISYTAILCVIGAFIIFCDSIFRSFQHPKLSVYATIFEVLANTSLNYCLIFGNLGFPELGVEGAAIGTIIARLLRAIISFLLLINLCPELITINNRNSVSITLVNIHRYMYQCLPIVGNSLVWIGALFAYQFFVGTIDSEAVALYAIIVPIESVVISISWGIASAGGVLVGEAIGSNSNAKANSERVTDNTNVISVKDNVVITATFIGIILSTIIVLLKPYLIDFYSSLGPQSLLKLETLLTILAFSVFLKTLSMLFTAGILVSSGDSKFTFYASTFSQWFITVPMCAIATITFNVSIEILVFLMLTEELLKLLLSLHRMQKNKWIRYVLD